MKPHPAEQSLLGLDVAAICERFGAPSGCEHEAGVLRLVYGETGAEALGHVEMVDGVVTHVAGDLDRSVRRGGDQDLVGWPVEAVASRFGRPLLIERVGDNTRLEFARAVVTAHDGTVACVVSATDQPAA